jgi:hypothetical protein
MENIQWIYSEVNKREVYKDCATIDQLDEYLKSFGFVRVATRWAFRSGWGDALWIKRSSIWWTTPRRFLMGFDNTITFYLYIYRYFKRKLANFATT